MIDIDLEEYGRYLMTYRHYSDIIRRRDISFIRVHLQDYTIEDILQVTDPRVIVESITGVRYSSGKAMNKTKIASITHLQDYLRNRGAAA